MILLHRSPRSLGQGPFAVHVICAKLLVHCPVVPMLVSGTTPHGGTLQLALFGLKLATRLSHSNDDFLVSDGIDDCQSGLEQVGWS